SQGQVDEQLDDGLLVGALQDYPHRGGVELELVHRAAMGEAVDPHAAVSAAHDLGHASPIADTLKRVGQGGTFKLVRIRQHIGDGRSYELRIIERQHNVG